MDTEPHFTAIVQFVYMIPTVRSAWWNVDLNGEFFYDSSRSMAHFTDTRHNNAMTLAMRTTNCEFHRANKLGHSMRGSYHTRTATVGTVMRMSPLASTARACSIHA